MHFISYESLAFLLTAILLYYCVFREKQQLLLLLFSILFYLFCGPKYILFPLAAAGISFFAAIRIGDSLEERMERKKDKSVPKEERKTFDKTRKAQEHRILVGAAGVCIGILCVVKYTDMVLSLIGKIINAAGIPGSFDRVGFILPLGISYYTFQTVGYLIDVSRGKTRPERNFFRFLLFILFSAQLISGPISRFDGLQESLYARHCFDGQAFLVFWNRILTGLVKKLIIADRMSGAVMMITGAPETYDGIYALLGMVGYTLWMYADFSGCMDIVIGAAGLFGVILPENFNRPFLSGSLAEFWTRWHMSLMQWMRDYVFYPAAASKAFRSVSARLKNVLPWGLGMRLPAYLASFTVWLITGLWHGASSRFVAWGMANFTVMTLSQECAPLWRKFHAAVPAADGRAWKAFMVVRTFFLFSFIEMFEYYSFGNVFRMAWNILTSARPSQLFDGRFAALGMDGKDLLICLAAWIFILLTGLFPEICPWYRGEEAEQKSNKPVFRHLGTSTLILLFCVLVFGRYGRGYEVADFFYNSF